MSEKSVWMRIKSFFKNLFTPQKKLPIAECKKAKEEIVESKGKKLEKGQFFEVYEKLKKGEMDVFSIDPDELEKMCMLLEEEIQLKEKRVEEKKNKIVKMEAGIQKMKEAL